MPSTTRGSILISTANDIGEALVEKLGGVGYSPNEWKEKYNLCGIAPVDSAPALSVLADSAGTGDERGSILIATADAIGAILNKKYNVLRGFKPKEWASACRKMKALEEGSVASSSIASFSDGADTVPLTSCVCNIDANLDGKSAVNAVHAGVNLFNKNAITPNTWIVVNSTDTEAAISYSTSDYIPVKANTKYYVSTKSSNRSAYYDRNKNGIAYFSFSGGASFTALYDGYIRLTINNNIDLDTFIVNEGDTQATYEAYKGETKTADLGRTIYGGTADIIKGEGKETCSFPTLLSSLAWSKTTISGHDAFYANLPDGYMGQGSDGLDGDCDTYAITTDANLGTDKTIRFYYNANFNISRCVIRDDQYASLTGAQFKETVSGNIVYELAESAQTDFTFEPVKIDSFPGVNNIWSDSGNTAVEYYQAPTPYARKTATGGIANFSDQRTDLPLTKAIANIAPSIAGKSAVNLYQGSEQYQPTTTYTAELGETVYGGSVDFVSGEVNKEYGMITFDGSSDENWLYSDAYGWFYIDNHFGDAYRNNSESDFMICNLGTQSPYVSVTSLADLHFACTSGTNSRFAFKNSQYSTVEDFKTWLSNNNMIVVYKLATPAESTIPGRVISPIEGVNNYWNDAGGDTEIQYFEDET